LPISVHLSDHVFSFGGDFLVLLGLEVRTLLGGEGKFLTRSLSLSLSLSNSLSAALALSLSAALALSQSLCASCCCRKRSWEAGDRGDGFFLRFTNSIYNKFKDII
jgi:hypothetical protein